MRNNPSKKIRNRRAGSAGDSTGSTGGPDRGSRRSYLSQGRRSLGSWIAAANAGANGGLDPESPTPPPAPHPEISDPSGSEPWADAQTVRDLELFRERPEDGSIFTLLDRTRTVGGRDQLRRLLEAPLQGRAEIESRQAAIRFLGEQEDAEVWLPRISDRATVQLEDYLDSYIHPIEGRPGPVQFFRAWWFRSGYREYFEYLDGRVRTLHRFVLALSQLRPEISGPVPREIAGCLLAFDKLLENERTREFLRAGGRYSRFPFWRMLHFDHGFRFKRRALVRDALDAVYRLDALLSAARAARDLELTFPEVSETDPGIQCLGLRHPWIEDGVRNDVLLEPPQHFLFLTGPNMAGKTTLMKALGVAVYLAHVGFPVPCRSMRLGLLDGIVSSLNVEDNLGRGYSYFFAEVQRVKEVALQLSGGRRLLVLFDELFKGTNLTDAIEGSRMVIDGFLRFPASFFTLSTHLLELGHELGQAGIRFQCFTADVEDGRPRFSYELEDGLSDERLGLLILEAEGIPELLRGPLEGADPPGSGPGSEVPADGESTA